MKNYKISLSNEAKERIKNIYRSNIRLQIGAEYATIVLTKLVRKKSVSYEQINEIIIAAMKATIVNEQWLDLLIVVSNEMSNASAQS